MQKINPLLCLQTKVNPQKDRQLWAEVACGAVCHHRHAGEAIRAVAAADRVGVGRVRADEPRGAACAALRAARGVRAQCARDLRRGSGGRAGGGAGVARRADVAGEHGVAEHGPCAVRARVHLIGRLERAHETRRALRAIGLPDDGARSRSGA